MRPLSHEDLEHLLLPILSAEQQQRLGQEEEVAFTYRFERDNLFRVSVSKKGGQFMLSAQWLEVAS